MIKHIAPENPINRISITMQETILRAQSDAFDSAYSNAADFLKSVLEQLRIQITVPIQLASVNACDFSDKSFGEFSRFFTELLRSDGYPEQAIARSALALSTRAMLLRAFADPDAAVCFARDKVIAVVASFPKTAADIECGRNKGDVLDPFIIAATQFLLYQGEFDGAVSATVSHKAFMIIEGLLGHLHEDVLGLMRGNVRVPEPRGEDQETFNYETNPFPGSDVIQPPTKPGERLRIHQIKSKTVTFPRFSGHTEKREV